MRWLALLFSCFFWSCLPKLCFVQKVIRCFLFLHRSLNFSITFYTPWCAFLFRLQSGILRFLFNVRLKEDSEPFVKTDVESYYQQSNEQNEEHPELNKELFENALSLPTIKVRRCLVPRTEIEAVDIKTPIDVVKQKFLDTKLSRMVVFENNIDNIAGYIHLLDLFKKPAGIQSILLPIPAVPESMSATDLITKFSRERKSIAWVIDEFGGHSRHCNHGRCVGRNFWRYQR